MSQGLIIANVSDDGVKLSAAKDVVVSDRCTNCGDGWIVNPTLTMTQEALSDGKE